jgi:hypothetical protein
LEVVVIKLYFEFTLMLQISFSLPSLPNR